MLECALLPAYICWYGQVCSLAHIVQACAARRGEHQMQWLWILLKILSGVALTVGLLGLGLAFVFPPWMEHGAMLAAGLVIAGVVYFVSDRQIEDRN